MSDADLHPTADPQQPDQQPDGGPREPDEDGLFPAPYSPAPRTGDGPVDEALADLEQAARDGDLDAQAHAGERVHARLQERLQDLGRG